MSVIQIETLNRFPIHGGHLRLLAETVDGPLRASSAPVPESTSRRLIGELTSWGLLRREPQRRGFYGAMGLDLAQATALALRERHDLPDLLHAPSALAVLAALPTPTRRLCAGVSGPTWRNTLAELHRAQVVLRRPGVAWVNEELPGLRNLVAAYRRLHARWDPEWAGSGDGRVVALPIHQRGVEAAWRVVGARHLRLRQLDWSQPVLERIAPSAAVAYRGARELDSLDAILLAIRSETGLGHTEVLLRSDAVDVRLSGLLAAACGARDLGTRRFEDRFQFYGLATLFEALWLALEAEEGPIWHACLRYRDAYGVQEGLFR